MLVIGINRAMQRLLRVRWLIKKQVVMVIALSFFDAVDWTSSLQKNPVPLIPKVLFQNN